MSLYSIGKYAKETGGSISTLRRWDKEGKILPAFVSEVGARYYSDEQLFDLLGKPRAHKAKKMIEELTKNDSDKEG